MSDLKEKFKKLVSISDGDLKIPSMGFSSELYEQSRLRKSFTASHDSQSVNSIRSKIDCNSEESEISLKQIVDLYSQFNGDEVIVFELKKMCANCDKELIRNELEKLRADDKLLNHKLRNSIVQKQPKFDQQLQEINEMTTNIDYALEKVKNSRNLFREIKKELSGHVKVLANFRKRQHLEKLLKNLNIIRNLYEANSQIHGLIVNKEYNSAIGLLHENLELSKRYRHFTCTESIENKLQDTKLFLEESLDKCLESLCANFDSQLFDKLQKAYILLNNELIFVDQLLMHYTSTIYSVSLRILQEFFVKSSPSLSPESVAEAEAAAVASAEAPSPNTSPSTNGKQFNQLSKSISANHFLDCLKKLCTHLLFVLQSYYQLTNHYQKSNRSHEYDSYIGQKIGNGVIKIWNDVQNKVKTLLENCDAKLFKSFENFGQILLLVVKMNKVGENFLNCSQSIQSIAKNTFITLEDAISKNMLIFFEQFHRLKIDELLIFFENETWLRCPIRANFNVKQLREFWSLRILQTDYSDDSSISNTNSELSDNFQLSIFKQNKSYIENLFENSDFEIFTSLDNEDILNTGMCSIITSSSSTSSSTSLLSTSIQLPPKQSSSLPLSSSSSSSSISSAIPFADIYQKSELKQQPDTDDDSNLQSTTSSVTGDPKDRNENVDENDTLAKPVVTNSSLNLLRTIGRYLRISQLLPSFQHQILSYSIQLFQCYVCAIFMIFSSQKVKFMDELMTSSLSKLINDCKCNKKFDSLSEKNSLKMNATMPGTLGRKTFERHSQSLVSDLVQRIVAIESCVTLALQFAKLKCYMDDLQNDDLNESIDNMSTIASDLKKVMYLTIIEMTFDSNEILNLIKSINWNFKEISSQQNKYVDLIQKQLQTFLVHLSTFAPEIVDYERVRENCLESYGFFVTHLLVEGYATVRKCSTAGRALMQLDLTQLDVSYGYVAQSTKPRQSRRPSLPFRSYADQFIKAFYFPDAEFENWLIANQNRYTVHILRNFIESRYHNKKQIRQHLLNLVTDRNFATND